MADSFTDTSFKSKGNNNNLPASNKQPSGINHHIHLHFSKRNFVTKILRLTNLCLFYVLFMKSDLAAKSIDQSRQDGTADQLEECDLCGTDDTIEALQSRNSERCAVGTS